MPLVQVQQGEPFKHCSGSAFLLFETLNTELRSRWQSLRSAAGGGKSEQGLAQARDFLNSFSPSRPILRPKLSDILRHLLEMGIKKEPCGSGVYEKGAAWVGAPFVVNCSINGNLPSVPMDAFFYINVFLLDSRHVRFRFAYANKARHQILFWEAQNVSRIFAFIAKRNTESATITF